MYDKCIIAECDCSKERTEYCDKTNGNCVCMEDFCGVRCQSSGSTCCHEGSYYDVTSNQCKGQCPFLLIEWWIAIIYKWWYISSIWKCKKWWLLETLFNSTFTACDCSTAGTNSCDTTNGNCNCNEGFCGQHCENSGGMCCQEGFYYDDSSKDCKGLYSLQIQWTL